MSQANFSLSSETKYMLFMFLGLMVAILVLGYHKSPTAGAALGNAQRAASTPLSMRGYGSSSTARLATTLTAVEDYATPAHEGY